MRRAVIVVTGLLMGSPVLMASEHIGSGASDTALPAAQVVLGNNAVESDPDFDAFVLSRLSDNAEYSLLANQLGQAELKIEQEDAADALRVTMGAKHRPAGEQNNTVSDLGGYLSVQKTLYDWGRVDNRVAAAEQELNAQVFENSRRQSQLSEELATLYFEVLKADIDLQYMSNQLIVLEKVLKDMRDRVTGGSGSSLDHEIMEDEYLSLNMEIRARELERNRYAGEFENNYGQLPLNQLLPQVTLPDVLMAEGWETEFIRRNAEIQALRKQIEATRNLKDAHGADYFPTLNFSASYVEVDLEYKWFTTLDMSYEVLNGDKARLGVAEQELKITELMLKLKSQYKKSRDQMRALLADYEAQESRFWIYEKITSSKRQLYRVMDERMRSTQGNLREIYNARKAAIDANIKRDHAYLDAVLNAYKARLLLGEEISG